MRLFCPRNTHVATSMSSKKDITDLIEESLKMKSFHHPNVLHLIGVCIDAGAAPYLVMPYMLNGSLLSYLRKERPKLTIVEGATEDLVCVHSWLQYWLTSKFPIVAGH